MNNQIQVIPRTRTLTFMAAALATTALSAHAGTQTDPVTGQVWNVFYNVSDGLAQGYRRATVDDFKQLLADSNWLPREGTTSVYDFTSGANYLRSVNTPNIDFALSYHTTSLPDTILRTRVQAAWLQDGDTGNALGLVEKGWSSSPNEWLCMGHVCSNISKDYFNNTAEIVSAPDLATKFAAGNYPSTFTGASYGGIALSGQPFDPLIDYRDTNGAIQTGTFMITSVPEPANAALLSLGLMGVVAAMRVRRSVQDDHQG